MKKLIRNISCLAVGLAFILAGCSSGGNAPSAAPIENWSAPDYGTEYYDNYQYNAYYNPEGAAEHLPDQGTYGSGNAFILRYTGIYYMYMGSSNFASSSLPCWQSEDLMTWEKVNNGINPEGFVAQDARLFNTYPPCVRQYNNEFFMYLYIKNDVITQGNYILKADSPIGPFDFVTDDSGQPVCYTIAETNLNIDCDIFIDDNEDIYFMSGHQDNYFTGIRAFKMPDMESVSYGENDYINIAESSVGGWTEGNGFFKRDEKYYLMYTGSDILSPGYLTHYSVSLDDGWKESFGTDQRTNAPGFEQGLDWPMGCETDPEFYSLGHATSLLGPDMDGLYYHYFSVNSAGPNCSFCIDRLIFNGSGMDSAQTQYHSVKPKRPKIYSYSPEKDDAFVNGNGSLLSKNKTDKIFTAEFNFVGSNVKCVFAYQNQNNYAYVKTDIQGKTVMLYKVENGTERKIAEGSIVRAYDADNLLQTVRVAYREGKADVYFDDLLKISDAEIQLETGNFGYLWSGDADFEYTAASSVAKGLSDQLEPKQSYINIGAASYLPAGIYENCGSYFGNGSGYYETTDSDYDGKYTGLGGIKLNNAGDTAVYLVDFAEDRTGQDKGYYALYMTLNKSMAGKTFGVRVDGGEMYTVTVPTVSPTSGDDIVKTFIADIPVQAGVRQISFVCLGEELQFHSFTFAESTSETFVYESDLSAAPAYGMEQVSLWRFASRDGDEQPSLESREGARSLVWFGGSDLHDYTLECDFRINVDSTYTAGFILHGARYSNSAYVSEDYRYIQGYYVALNKRMVRVEKLNYTHTDSGAASQRIALDIMEWHHAKITVSGSALSVTITSADGIAETLLYVDDISFVGGRIGFYSSGASMSYRNLKIEG